VKLGLALPLVATVPVAGALASACSDDLRAPSCIDDAAACRARCAYGSGDVAEVTLADVAPDLYGHIPIDTFVLVMQENRTFDHYFSSLTVPGQTVDGASPDATNPDPTGATAAISRFHQTAYCFDNPAESWDQVHREIDGGALDGFTTQNASADDPTGARSMGYYDATDLPYYYALAQAFAISDRHFASVQANTWPNRMFYMAGTARGITSDVFPPTMDGSGHLLPDLFTRLDDAHVSWAFYVQDVPTLGIIPTELGAHEQLVLPYSQFATDAAAGVLPHVVFVEGSDLKGGVSPDEDPPADVQVGQAFVHDIVDATMHSPQWPRAALLFSYDEQGGLYDHVAPPAACVPDDTPPDLGSGDVMAGYDALGLRVPLIAVSPYARRGYVSHVVTDHTSILRLVEARFELPALTHRDANAIPPLDMFDFAAEPDLTIPTLPDPPIDATQQQACAATYPPSSE
jgi:phospholipase C